MKRLLILAAVCFVGLLSSCQKQDYSVSLVGTKWEAFDSHSNVTDKYVMELKTETTGVLSYYPEKGEGEVADITYDYNYPEIILHAKRDGKTFTEKGTVSDNFTVITLDFLTFNRK